MRVNRYLGALAVSLALVACGVGGGAEGETPPAANMAPIADASTAQTVMVGTVVTLNGGASSDGNGDALTYAWTLARRPAGSSATLLNATSASPTFVPDVAGTYVGTLIVNDGTVDSSASTVEITAFVGNAPPVAHAGAAQYVIIGTVVTLNGSASSDANGDTLTYAWTLTGQPNGSAATLSNPTSTTPTFMPSIAGTYTATLTVNDGTVTSSAATVLITATGAPNGLERLYGQLTLNYMFTGGLERYTDTIIFSPQNLSSDGTTLSALAVGNPARAMTCGLSPHAGLGRTYLCHILDADFGWTEMFLFSLNGRQIADGLYEYCAREEQPTIASCTADLLASPDGFLWGGLSP